MEARIKKYSRINGIIAPISKFACFIKKYVAKIVIIGAANKNIQRRSPLRRVPTTTITANPISGRNKPNKTKISKMVFMTINSWRRVQDSNLCGAF